MAEKPNDRPRAQAPGRSGVEPRLYVVIDGKRFPRPGLETVFVDTPPDRTVVAGGCACKPVAIPICACIKVCQCVPVCSCVGHTPTGGGVIYGCRCAPVH